MPHPLLHYIFCNLFTKWTWFFLTSNQDLDFRNPFFQITNVKAAYPRIAKTGLKYLSGGYWKLYSTKLYPKETCQIWSPFLWGINACEWEHTWLSVNVPVLSLQIVVAEPIVSQAESLRTCISKGVNKRHYNRKIWFKQ